MSDEVLIKVENVGKKFCRSLKRSMLYGVEDIVRDTLSLKTTSDKLRPEEFWAVDDVSFEVRRGECLGIIGRNGAGKSTLLKMLNGIFMPDKGKITIKGKVGALIEVGAGFHPMLTGRENIYVNGAILGMSKREIDKKFDEIVAFAELEDFIDMPVKHYSSGMYVRLGFAIAVQMEPDALILDEIFAVGDVRFRAKCFQKLSEYIDKQVSILIVSHEMQLIQRLTNKSLLLTPDKCFQYGNTNEIIERFYQEISDKQGLANCFDHENIAIKEVNIISEEKNTIIKKWEPFYIEINYQCKQAMEVHFSVAFHNLSGEQIAAFRTDDELEKIKLLPSNSCFRLFIKDNSLSPGLYYLSARVYDATGLVLLVNHQAKYKLLVTGKNNKIGFMELKHQWQL